MDRRRKTEHTCAAAYTFTVSSCIEAVLVATTTSIDKLFALGILSVEIIAHMILIAGTMLFRKQALLSC